MAVPLPADLREALRVWVEAVRSSGSLDADWRWADPGGWHVTLAFLGATPPEAISGITERLATQLAGRSGFSVTAGGIGAFPSRGRARVLWYGIRDADGRLTDLAEVVRAATGIDAESAFRPHVTLARARDRRGTPLPELAANGLPEAVLAVDSVHLMRSRLGQGPARYETLVEVPLSTRVPAASPA